MRPFGMAFDQLLADILRRLGLSHLVEDDAEHPAKNRITALLPQHCEHRARFAQFFLLVERRGKVAAGIKVACALCYRLAQEQFGLTQCTKLHRNRAKQRQTAWFIGFLPQMRHCPLRRFLQFSSLHQLFGLGEQGIGGNGGLVHYG